MKLEKKPDVELAPAHINPFSKKSLLRIPDSPPPEPEKESPPKEGEKSKFERLMQAACSIKTQELEARRRKFETMAEYLKAGVYYTTKLEAVRHPSQGYFQRLMAYELLIKTAGSEVYQNN